MTVEHLHPQGRLLNHVELVYRPGERSLAGRLFETLGCKVVETGGPYLVIQICPGLGGFFDNVLYVSEVTSTQLQLESVLQRELSSHGELRKRFREFQDGRRDEPQRTTHFGIRMRSTAELDGILERVRSLEDPELQGRVSVTGVFRPGDPGALSDSLVQAFLHTDICAAGLLSFGQAIELQAQIGAQ